MLITFLIAAGFAKKRGCDLKIIFKSIALYPPAVCEVIYLIMQFFVFQGNYDVIAFADVFKKTYMLSFLFPIIWLKLYKQGLIGSIFVMLGTASNNLVMNLNDGKMPVFPTISYWTGYVKNDTFQKVNDIHVLGTANTKMIILSDVFDVGWSVLSIGDIFIRIFVGIIVYSAIVELNKRSMAEFNLKPILKS